MKKITYIVLGLFSLLFTSCYYDKEELLYPASSCNTNSNISYSTDLVPILNTRCYFCHSSSTANLRGAGIKLDSYIELKSAIESKNLLPAINHSGSSSPMPQNSTKLTSCQISAFETWVFEGKKDN